MVNSKLAEQALRETLSQRRQRPDKSPLAQIANGEWLDFVDRTVKKFARDLQEKQPNFRDDYEDTISLMKDAVISAENEART